MAESDIGLALISEPPPRLNKSTICFLSEDKLAAVLWRPESSRDWNCRVLEVGVGYIIVLFGNIRNVSCYVSPNVNSNNYLRFLDNLNNACNVHNSSLIVSADFNALF